MSRVTALQQQQQSGYINKSSTSLVTPAVSKWSNYEPGQVESHAFDLLTQEVLVNTLFPVTTADIDVRQTIKTIIATPSEYSSVHRLDRIGYRIGWLLSERLLASRPLLPRSAPPIPPSSSSTSVASSSEPAYQPAPIVDPLECIKFVCKDVWTAVFDKQVDNLRTNHRGVWVIQDNSFRPLLRVAGRGAADWTRNAVAIPCGIVRGALANLGHQVTVTAESPALPQCTFQIKLVKSGM